MPTIHSSRTIAVTCAVALEPAQTGGRVYPPKTYTYSFPADSFAQQVTGHAKRKYARDNKLRAAQLGIIDTACTIAGHRAVDSDLKESVILPN